MQLIYVCVYEAKAKKATQGTFNSFLFIYSCMRCVYVCAPLKYGKLYSYMQAIVYEKCNAILEHVLPGFLELPEIDLSHSHESINTFILYGSIDVRISGRKRIFTQIILILISLLNIAPSSSSSSSFTHVVS